MRSRARGLRPDHNVPTCHRLVHRIVVAIHEVFDPDQKLDDDALRIHIEAPGTKTKRMG